MRTDASKRIEFTPLKDRPILSWNNMVSMERFLITNDAFRGWLHLNGFGIHTVATMDHKHANEFLAKKGEVVCYLNPMEVLFLVNELKVCDMSEDTFYGYHILTDSELALKLVNEACMEPKIYVRYRLHRKYYHCIVFNNFAGARFAIYKEPPSIAHAVGLCYWETDLLSIQATARVVESIKKTAIVIGTETPPVDTNVFLWFRNSYIFHDITCPLVPSLDIHFEMSAELARAPP